MASKLAHLVLPEIEETGISVGEGSYGRVTEVKVRGLRCVGKKLHAVLLEGQPDRLVDRFVSECLHHSKLRHPNIVQLIGVHYTDPSLSVPTIIMEYLPMSLTQCLDRYPRLPTHVEHSILLDVATGLQYLHGQSPPIMHRDLTPNNILLTGHMQAKITDFGQSKILNLSPSNKQTTAPGNMCYTAPEALVSMPEYTTKVDIFSFAILILHVATHEWPFRQTFIDPKTQKTMPLTEVEKRKVFIDKLSEDSHLKPLAVKCLDDNPTRRPNAVKLVKELSACSLAAPFVNTLEMELALESESAQANKLKAHVQEVDIHIAALANQLNWSLDNESSCDFPTVPDASTLAQARLKLREMSLANKSVLDGAGHPELIVGYKSPVNNSSKQNLSVSLEQGSSPIAASRPMDVIVRAPLSLHFTGTLVHTIEGLKDPWGLAAGGSGRVFITDSGGYKGVLLYDRTGGLCGEYVDSLYKYNRQTVEGKCYYPRGIAVDGDGFILADTWCHRIQRFNLSADLKEAEFQKSAGSEGDGESQLSVPLSVRVNQENGDVYVCDKNNHRIQVLNRELQFRRRFGKRGSGRCEFENPQDIAFDSKGNIYVADCGNYTVKVFNRKWDFLGMIGGPGRGKGTFQCIRSICIDKNDYLYVTDEQWNCIQVFNPRREFVMQIKLPALADKSTSKPCGIAVDEEGFVYVSCRATTCVHIYK